MSPLGRWVRWVLVNAAGELFGLGAVFLAGWLAFRLLGEPRGGTTAALYLALALLLGAYEGVVVGFAQTLVLRDVVPAVPRRAWIAATVVGAVVAWLLGMLPSTVASLRSATSTPAPEPPLFLVLLLASAMGLAGGLVLAGAQSWVLRRIGARAGRWLLANALAWALAMPWIFLLVDLTVGDAQSLARVAAFLAGLGVAGALVGAVHGLFLVRYLGLGWREA